MSIARVLNTKGHAVPVIAETAQVADAVSELARQQFGALVVLDSEARVTGILSERDVVSHLAGGATALLGQPVSAIMTPSPISCTRDGRIRDVLQMMVGWNIRHVPVLEAGELLGVVYMSDLVSLTLDSVDFDAVLPPRAVPDAADPAWSGDAPPPP